MAEGKESLYHKDWYEKARQDLEAAKILLSSGKLETGSFHIQQALEKFIKGFLLSKGWKLRRVHDLEDLLDEAVKYNSDLEKYRSICQIAAEYYIEERYPFLLKSKLSRGELEQVLSQAQDFIRKIISESS